MRHWLGFLIVCALLVEYSSEYPVSLTLYHDEYLMAYVGSPGSSLTFRYDILENGISIFNDETFRTHSHTYQIGYTNGYGIDVFQLGNFATRLPVLVGKPKRYEGEFYNTIWVKYDGVFGLGPSSPIWKHFHGFTLEPGRIILHRMDISVHPTGGRSYVLPDNFPDEYDPLLSEQLEQTYYDVPLDSELSRTLHSAFNETFETSVRVGNEIHHLLVQIELGRETSLLPPIVYEYLFGSTDLSRKLEIVHPTQHHIRFSLSRADFSTYNFQGIFSEETCEFNHMDSKLILGRTIVHGKRCVYQRSNSAFSAYPRVELVGLRDHEAGVFRNRMKNDSGFVIPILIIICVISIVFSVMENVQDSEESLLFGKVLDLYALLLGSICYVYYFVGIGLWNTTWPVCGEDLLCIHSCWSSVILSLCGVPLLCVEFALDGVLLRIYSRAICAAFLMTTLWIPTTIYAFWSEFAMALSCIYATATAVGTLSLACTWDIGYSPGSKHSSINIIRWVHTTVWSGCFWVVQYKLWRFFIAHQFAGSFYEDALFFLFAMGIPGAICVDICLKIKASNK